MESQRWIRTDTILLTAGLLLLSYFLGEVLLLVFAALLLSVGFDGVARATSERLHVSRGWALLGVVLAITTFIFGSLALTATQLIQQFMQVSETVVEFVERVQAWLSEHGAMSTLTDMNDGEDNGGLASVAREMAGRVMTFGMTAFGAVTSLVILVVLTVFLSSNPNLYRDGAVVLVPPPRRAMAEDTLSAMAHALRWWFLGQFVSMALLGITVGLGLFILGVELWLALAVLTALLTIVPFIGPLIATVPIVAVGFAEGVTTGVIVLVGYMIIQNIEGNFVGPMVQQKAVNLAPALLITAQVLLSIVFGVAGLILAAPITIVAMVAVRKLWVEHALGEQST